MHRGTVYVLEVNPRASRTVPFVSKSTGIPLAKIAAKVMVGRTLRDLNIRGYGWAKHVSVKESVFPFPKFPEARHFPGPEMRSTGEVMGISDSFGISFAKASIAAGMNLPKSGSVFVSLNDYDKREVSAGMVRMFVRLGFTILATKGTAEFLERNGISSTPVLKAGEPSLNIVDIIRNGWVQLIVNTPLGQVSRQDEHAIGRAAYEHKVPFITTIAAAASAAKSIRQMKDQGLSAMSIQEFHELAAQGGPSGPVETLEDCSRLVEYIKSFQI
jgi:carbamoyl-phosphate synthase large subunit